MLWLRLSLAVSCSVLLGGLFASASYAATTTVFKDDFESGSLTAWTDSHGTGQETVTSAAAHTGSYGLNLSGTSGQSEEVVKTLSVPLADSTIAFWMRVDSASGIPVVAETRDLAGTGYEWVLKYDSAHQQFEFYPYKGGTSTEIVTGAGSAPLNMWLKVVIDYDATSTGGARLGINGHSPPNWSVSGNYARSDGLQRLQLGDNNAGAADFDDLFLATTDGTGAGLPVDNSPPAVSGTPGQGQTLTATSGSWGGAGNKYWYSWQDCDRAGNNCVTISGATSSTYVVQSSDAGHTIRAVVQGRNSVGWASTRSAQTAPVTVPAGLNGIKAGSGEFVDDSGTPILLHGVNRSGTEYQCIHNDGIFDGPSTAASIAAMASWHINIVRIGLNEDCWLGINGVNPAYSGQNYINAIVNYVSLLHEAGMYAEISLMWTAPGTSSASSQIAAPDEDHSPAVWQGMADAFKNDPNVILAPFGEPTVGWSCWIQGCAAGASGGTSYATAGAQQAINVMRGEGYNGVIAVSCVSYANSCSGWSANHPTDPDNNLAVEVHIYGGNGCDTDSCFNSTMKPIQSAGVPVLAGETGEYYNGSDCPSTSYISDFLNYYKANNWGYEVWTWDTWGGCSTLSLISNYDGTALAPIGTSVQNFMTTNYPPDS